MALFAKSARNRKVGKTFLSGKKHRGCARIDGTKKAVRRLPYSPMRYRKAGEERGSSAPLLSFRRIGSDLERYAIDRDSRTVHNFDCKLTGLISRFLRNTADFSIGFGIFHINGAKHRYGKILSSGTKEVFTVIYSRAKEEELP